MATNETPVLPRSGQVEARLSDGVRFADGTVLCDRGPHLRTDVQV